MYYLHILLSCQTQNNNNNWWVSSNLAMRRWLCINVALLVGFYLSRKVEIPWCHISGTTNLPMSLGPSAMPIITLKFHFKYSCLAQGRIFINQHCVPCVKHHFHSLKYLQMVQWLAFVNTALLFIWQALESSIPVLLIHIVQYHCWCHLPQCSHLCLPHHDPTQLVSSCHPDLVCNDYCSTLKEMSLFAELNEGALELGRGCLEMEMGHEYQECGRKGCSGFGRGKQRTQGLLWHQGCWKQMNHRPQNNWIKVIVG